MTTATTTTAGNAKKLARLEAVLAETLALALRRGFFGTAAVAFTVQDGTIQNIRWKLERIEEQGKAQ